MPLRARFAFAVLFAAMLPAPGPASAQDKKEDGAKARAAAAENFKKIKIDKPTIVETDHFVVAGTVSQEKAKALGAVLERTLAVARKAAQYDEKEEAWKGKLTVYFLPDADEYKSFMRRVLQAPPEGAFADFRDDQPLLVDPADLPGKPSEAELYARTAARVAGELLKAKGTGTQAVPEWLRDGFGRAAAVRAEGANSKRYQAYRAQARRAVLTPQGGKYATIADAMSGDKSSELLATHLAEFLAFGPPSKDFGKFLDALRPGEANPNPTVQSGFTALGWKDQAAAELAWRRWAQAGK